MIKAILTRTSLTNNPKEVAVHLAEDGYGKIDPSVHVGKISESIPLQSAGVLIILLMLVTYFRGYVPGTYGGLYAYGIAFALGGLYMWMSTRAYRAACTIKMLDIIKEYRHHETSDQRILRNSINQIRRDEMMIDDFPKLLRATFLDNKKDNTAKEKSYDKIIEDAEKENR